MGLVTMGSIRYRPYKMDLLKMRPTKKSVTGQFAHGQFTQNDPPKVRLG